MLQTYEQHAKTKLIATALSILVIAGSVLFADHYKAASATTNTTPAQTAAAPTTSTSTPTTTTTTPATTSTTSSSAASYKDGSYTASSDYYVPHGNENIQVTVTIKDGVVTDSSIQNSEGDRESAAYQESFAAVYKSYVVGKKISDLKLGIVAGASDTTQGFNDALSQITSKAQA